LSLFIVRRLGFVLLSMLMASIIIFAATQVIPGDIASVILGQFATPEAKANLRAELGLNRPLIVQYLDWLWNFIQGDWGVSTGMHVPVRPLVMARLNNTLVLAAVGFAMFVPLGILLGVISAIRRNSWIDHSISISALVFVGLPEFVTGIILIYIFALQLGWLPAQSSVDYSGGILPMVPMLVLPGITVSLLSLAYIARMTRSSTVDVLQSDYVRTAYLKGLSPSRVIRVHVLRNSLMPTVAAIALCVGWLVSGLIVTESVFGYPGLGRLLLFAAQYRDIPVLQAVSMIVVVVVGVVNLLADITYAWLNPRIAYR